MKFKALFAALLLTATKWRGLAPNHCLLVTFSLPIVAIVCTQALLDQAYANWAASAYLAGTIAAIAWLANKPRAWLIASFTINGALCLLCPIAATMPEALTRQGQPLLNRYIGRTDMTEAILDQARAAGLTTIVAEDRDILADLFFTARDSEFTIRAVPPQYRAPHHYALKFPYQANNETIIFVQRDGLIPYCSAAIQIKQLTPATGAYRKHPMNIYRMPGTCLK